MNDNYHLTLIKRIDTHTQNVNNLLFFYDGRIITCSGDQTIKVFNKFSYQCELILTGHTRRVYGICLLPNNKIASCSSDKTIRIWTINTKTFICDFNIDKALKS